MLVKRVTRVALTQTIHSWLDQLRQQHYTEAAARLSGLSIDSTYTELPPED